MSLQPPGDKRASLADAVALVSDGAMVALGGGLCARLPMAMVRELIRQGRRGLHLIGSAHSIDVDLLVATGAVRRCEESYVGFEQDLGLAPGYRRAAEAGTIEIAESCCATILAQLRAAEMGLPFLPVRGVRGSDIRRLHPEYAEITCPFTGEILVAVPALRPDVALLHAPAGDRYGNLHLEQPYVLDERFASASRLVVATVDELVSTEEVVRSGVTIPAHLVAAVAEVPYGAHPSSCYPRYAYDRGHLREYLTAAQAGAGDLDKYVATYVQGSEESYREAIGPDRLGALAGWSQSVTAWQEVFR
jgi:glutaconate CoA-transferase subunit A